MDQNITAHFTGIETSNQPMKSIIFSVEKGTKSALTKSLEKLKKEVNTFLTECIEKNKTTSPHVDSMYTDTLFSNQSNLTILKFK